MDITPQFIIHAIIIGTGATIVLDIWAIFLKLAFDLAPSNYGLFGRWLGHFSRGQFVHNNIAQAAPFPHEKILGWASHYAIGIIFAALLLILCGPDWMNRPTLLPALLFGIATVVAPFFIMQPGMGLGIAASKTPNPAVARLRSLAAHTVFGAGLYASALLITELSP